MKTLPFLILLVFAQINLCAQTNVANLKPEQYFDFWLGEWNLTWQSSENKTGKGENHIFKALGEKVIEENFKVIDDANINGYVGKSWSVYNKNNDTWHQTWVDNQGAYLDFIGEIDGNKRIFKRLVTKTDGSKIYQRMVFYDIQENSFTWDWESSSDNGSTWNLLWRINYNRK